MKRWFRKFTCHNCQGTGRAAGYHGPVQCQVCFGAGYLEEPIGGALATWALELLFGSVILGSLIGLVVFPLGGR